MINNKDIKIIDFGFATETTKEEKGNSFWGTPSYMSPEIVNHQSHNYMKADIWALGVILYALISGNFPFVGQNDKDLFNKIRRWIFTIPDGLTLEAKSMILSMLQSDPAFRKGTGTLLKDYWFWDTKHLKSEASPSLMSKRSNIVGTIDELNNIYSEKKPIIITREKSDSSHKRNTPLSPYLANNHTMYNAFKNNRNFIKTYFKNTENYSRANKSNTEK